MLVSKIETKYMYEYTIETNNTYINIRRRQNVEENTGEKPAKIKQTKDTKVNDVTQERKEDYRFQLIVALPQLVQHAQSAARLCERSRSLL